MALISLVESRPSLSKIFLKWQVPSVPFDEEKVFCSADTRSRPSLNNNTTTMNKSDQQETNPEHCTVQYGSVAVTTVLGLLA